MPKRSRPLPTPTPTMRAILARLTEAARALDTEARTRADGGWDRVVRLELERAAGSVRLVCTLIVRGIITEPTAQLWADAADSYLELVRRADAFGVIQ